ncbi:MAG: arginine decarboxylase, partial [Myxococcota bacterium]
MTNWTIRDSLDLYHVLHWGSGFFAINDAGNVAVRPRTDDERSIDPMELVENLGQRGVRTPLLIRFNDILDSRVRGLNSCFRKAIEETDYRGAYRGVYPIKVNQQRHVVEELIQFGAPEKMGLEAGSKPELLIALALLDTPGALIICNGYKDRAYVETALLAQRLGRTPIIVVDRFNEIDLILKTSRELGIRPQL